MGPLGLVVGAWSDEEAKYGAEVFSNVWGHSGVGEQQEEFGQVGCGCCFEFGMMVWEKKLLFFLMLFVTRPRARDCQVEADRKLFWDWFFPLPGSWHRAPRLKCNVITAVIQLLRESTGGKTYLWKTNWLKFPLCPLTAVQHMLGNGVRWAGGLCQEVPWYIWMQPLVLGNADYCGEAAEGAPETCSSCPFQESFGHKIPQVNRMPKIHGNIQCLAVAEPSGRPGCLSCLQHPPSP